MPRDSRANQLQAARHLIETIRGSADLPWGAEPFASVLAKLRDSHSQAQALYERHVALTAQLREVAVELDEALREAQDDTISIRSLIRGRIPYSDKLLLYGVKPMRRRKRPTGS